jgi:hypothetical protein
VIKFLNSPAPPPPPPTVWALDIPRIHPVKVNRGLVCIMFWMRAYPILGDVGGGCALEFLNFLGPVKWH